MKRLSLLLAAVMLSVFASAETAKLTPTWEANYRTNNNEPTGWTKVTTSDAQFEVKNQARFFAVQTWTIANIDQVDSLEFMYQRVAGQTNNGTLSMWLFPYNSMVSSTADFETAGMAFLNDVKEVLGVYPGNVLSNAPFMVSNSVDSMGVHFRTINLGATEIEALKAAGTVTNNYLSVNVLLCTYVEDGNYAAEMNYKFYHTGAEAAYCTVHYAGEIVVPAILNNTTKAAYTDLATAVEEAGAGDVLTINEDVSISGERLTILKNLTLQGATGEEKIICEVPENTLMILANGNDEDYTVSIKNLIVDGQDAVRTIQTFDTNGKAKMAFDGVSVINTTYSSPAIGDVKSAGSNIILSGLNSFPAGIVLNKNKRIDHQGASHTAENPMKIILSGDYQEDYAIVLNCNDSLLYYAVDAEDEYDWELYVSNNRELKGRKTQQIITTAIVNKNSRAGYDDLALAIEEAAAGDLLMLYSDVTVSDAGLRVQKELTIQGHEGTESIICAVPADQILLIANDTLPSTMTLRNIIVDGQNQERSVQTFDNNGSSKLLFDGVAIINTSYTEGVGDVKCAGDNIVLSGMNIFPTGIVLNKNKRIDHQDATHTAEEPVNIILAADYQEDYAIVLHCSDSTLYTVEEIGGENEWELYVGNGELKGRKVIVPEAVDNVAVEKKAMKVMRDGQILIIKGDEMYDLLGNKQ